MSSFTDARQRAPICQDCWFWREMSCALANPEAGASCANRRPVRGRTGRPAEPAQAALVPLAEGHAVVLTPAAAAPQPFATDAPEANFSLAGIANGITRLETGAPRPAAASQESLEQPVRSAPPSFREIRSGRAAAAARAPIAEVRISLDEVGSQQLRMGTTPTVSPSPAAGDLDAMVERVRARTAARMSRAGAARS